ncbi:MAG TPA: hypothetical protein VFQ44_01720 [Streptosporangiaceae bacterium]|nr:hypothetical protein [Streptosporangiaceae bacterium]
MTIFCYRDGEELGAVRVASSTDEAPYREALAEAGWTVTGLDPDPERTGIIGDDAWTLARLT